MKTGERNPGGHFKCR